MPEVVRYNPQPPRPAWGIRLEPRKARSTARPITHARLPARVQLPLGLTPDRLAHPLVQAGDRVDTGQTVARYKGGARNAICASISGRVSGIRPCAVPGPGGHIVDCIVIDADGEDRLHPECRSGRNPDQLEPAELRKLIARVGIVGLGGALFPTAEKLAGSDPVGLLILNGAECEPYISCDDMLMRERADRVIDGARIMLRALDCAQAVIAVESDMPESRLALREALGAGTAPHVDLAVVTAKYPAGGERQLVEMLTGLEVPAGGLPRDIGIVCQNVATAAAVSELFRTGRPPISRIVTVTGSGVNEPVNVEARLGTPLADLVAVAGGYSQPGCRLIMGGPMMGAAIPGDRLPVTAATNCLLVCVPAELSTPQAAFPCIRCAECSRVCPARLLPQELLLAGNSGSPEQLEALHVDACIECGCCDYVCPSQLELTPRFTRAKARLRAWHEQQRRALIARQRSAAHAARVAAMDTEYADGPEAADAEAALAALRERLGDRHEGGKDE